MEPYQYQSQSQSQENKRSRQATPQAATSGPLACQYCGNPINANSEICPHCGRPVRDDHCTFCGTSYEGNEPFCSECGSPRAGIPCPKCGSLSFRSFCWHCNAPLNDNAMEALALAEKDPRTQRARQLAQEMAEMEKYLLEFQEEIEAAIAEAEMEGDGPDAPGLSAEGQQLQEKYAELLKLMGKAAAPKPATIKAEKPSVKRREQLKKKFFDADQIMEAYRKKSAEMQATLASMIPDAGTTPQIQRDYYCARKVAIDSYSKKQIPLYWTCNLCGCQHNQPSECADPSLGGEWTYTTITVRNRVWQYME